MCLNVKIVFKVKFNSPNVLNVFYDIIGDEPSLVCSSAILSLFSAPQKSDGLMNTSLCPTFSGWCSAGCCTVS